MIFRQIVHEDLGCASYLVGDEDAGVAAVVDPRLDIDEYLRIARYMGVRITDVLETHNHADHVSGHGRLVAATGARIHVHRLAAPDYDHEPFDDGWELALGAVRIRALHTPGHRPEHTAFLLFDDGRDPERPWAVLTGDTLFVGDVARPDLAIDKEDGARDIFHSLQDKLLVLPADVEVWPGHLGGSMCGGPGMDLKICSTIGYEQGSSDVLAITDEAAFVAGAIANLGPQPPNFEAIVALNRGPLDDHVASTRPLTPREVRAAQAAGGLVVDVRTDRQFDEAHVPGAVCIPTVRAGFGTKLAWLADRGRDVVLVGRDDADAEAAVALAGAVGITRIAGHLAGGMTTWREEGLPVDAIARTDVDAARARFAAGEGLQLLDVREQAEWDAGHVDGAVHRPYHDLAAGLPDALDPQRPIAVVCASGQRAATAASLVQRAGAREVVHVVGGGVPRWLREDAAATA